MPEPAKPERPLSLISVIKNAMGKDLMTLPLPVELHEPQTDLQKICENCEYSELVDQVRLSFWITSCRLTEARLCCAARTALAWRQSMHLVVVPEYRVSFPQTMQFASAFGIMQALRLSTGEASLREICLLNLHCSLLLCAGCKVAQAQPGKACAGCCFCCGAVFCCQEDAQIHVCASWGDI